MTQDQAKAAERLEFLESDIVSILEHPRQEWTHAVPGCVTRVVDCVLAQLQRDREAVTPERMQAMGFVVDHRFKSSIAMELGAGAQRIGANFNSLANTWSWSVGNELIPDSIAPLTERDVMTLIERVQRGGAT